MTGYLPTKSLGTHSSSFALSLGDVSKYRDKVVLKTGSLSLKGKYNSLTINPFIVGVNNLHLVGKRNDSQLTDTLEFSNPLSNSFTFDASGNYSTVYNESNSNITSFITFLPDSIFVSAEYIMNPDNNTAYKTVRIDDTISFVAKFTSKSVLSIKQTTFTDTVNINIDQDKRNQIINGKGAQLTVDIQNAIPLNSWVKVILTDNAYHPLLINGAAFAVTKNNNGTDSVSIAGAQTDGNGNYLNYSASNTTITLDSVQIRQFAQNAQHAIVSITVETSHSNNVPVIVHANDWIKLNVFGRVTYRVKKNN
jgi:FtsP/CotA-like multicopper oxidase with cupredoxin domain